MINKEKLKELCNKVKGLNKDEWSLIILGVVIITISFGYMILHL